jgi:CHAT domain-containing protein
MAREWLVFFRRLQPLLKHTPTGASLIALVTLGQVASLTLLNPGSASADVQAPIASSVDSELPNAPQLVQRGRELYEAERFSDAATVLQQAAQDYQTQGDELNQAMVLSNLSLTYQQLGQWPQATQAITESLKLLQAGQDEDVSAERSQILAQTLDIQGRLQLSLGQAESAIATWQQAAATYAQASNDSGITASMINQAQALQSLGLYRQVLTKLTQVNQTLKKQPNSLLKAAGLRSLGNALYGVGDLEQSRQVLQQSLAVAQQLQSAPDVGATLFSLGNTARAQQDTQAALGFYQQATTGSASQITQIQAQLNQLSLLLATRQRSAAQALWPQIQAQINNLPPSRTAVYAQINFAQSLTRLKQTGTTVAPTWPEIARLMVTAVKQAKNLGDQRAEAYALGNLGQLYEQTQQWSSAQALTQQALLLAQTINAPDIAYRWQWQLGRLLQVQRDKPGAIAAYTEAVNTLQSLRSDLVATNPEVQFSFRDSVEPVYRQLVGLLLQSGGTRPTQQNLAQARVVIESLQLAELENFFRAACLDAKPVLIDKIVEQDNPTTAVIYPIILADRLEVILKIPRQPLRHHTIYGLSQSEAETTLEQLRQKLTEPDAIRAVKSLSQQVYSWLIQPVEAELNKSGVKTLVFVPDGLLRNIPMAALYNGKQYLVEKYAVVLNPGLQLLDPKPLPQRRLKALAAGLTEPPRNFQNFSALLAVKSEFNLIKQAGVSASQLLDQEFTSGSLEKEINSVPFNVIHLATHGQFSSQAKDTFILASDGPINVNQLDNLLRRQNRPEEIELLVLSACETAAGDNRAALGLAGVAVRAGARSTLASLWQIDDESTAIFVGEFYRRLATAKVTKAEALRQAQMTLLQKYPNYSRPGYWAPYVLVGNWL